MQSSICEENFRVVVRVRPLSQKQREQINSYEQAYTKKMKNPNGRMIKLSPAAYSFYTKFYNSSASSIIKIDGPGSAIYVADPEYKSSDRKMKPYHYSQVYDINDKNNSIFEESLEQHVLSVLDGYNCTILAYGITGSGKTHTVFGSSRIKDDRGISYLIFDCLLQEKKRLLQEEQIKVTYKFSFIEIYNENVRDLLSSENNKILNIVEDYKGNTMISDLTELEINNNQQISHFITTGTTKRVFASTNANQYSSRSHAILQFNVQVEKANGERKTSKLFIIDLAGSEKLQSLNSSKKMQEGANINRSLLALGNCINTLAQNSRKNTLSHIPYRDSKLTRMLKDSLGGNARTIMIACISPNPFIIDQTLTTLNYANRAQGIQKKILKNSVEEDSNTNFCSKCKKLVTSVENQPQSQLGRNQKMELFEQIYEDILENIREGEKIKSFSNQSNISNSPDWLKVQCINQQQRIKLKEVLCSLMLQTQRKNDAAKGLKKQKYKQDQEQDKENALKISTTSIKEGRTSLQSLSNSKSRRRKSHNKFEIIKRPNSVEKERSALFE